jgi:ATP-binding cassette subfamily B protein
MPLLIISFLVIMYFAYPRFKKVQGALDELSNVVLENANAPQVVKSFVSQDYEAKRFEKVNDHYKEVNTNAESIVALAEPLIIMIFNLGLALILVLAGIYLNQANPAFFQNGLPKVGLIMAFSTYSQQILIGLMMFAMIMIFISRAEVSASRINEVMETLPSMLYNEHPVFPEIKGEISFNKVSFKYGESSADAIQDISFKLKPGESVGIIGSTGSGKTTLVRLLPRLYDHTEGEILLDGVPVESMDVTHLRDQISFVTQYAHIFSGSLGTNIIQGKQTADYEEVFKASQGASLDEFVSDQEEGLNLFVQAKGTNLSGGQKQRLSIARALIKNPKILILDDATSAVDLTTEKHIIESIQALKPKPTLLLITQKISTAKRLDKILVLDNDGHMDGFGTHETLLKSSKVYQEIAASQLNVGGESHGA